jgi:hypothetical protein
MAEADRSRRRRCGGGVLAEFALVASVLWMLLAGALDLGRALATANRLDAAARAAARALAVAERPAGETLAQALAGAGVFDPGYLVLDLARLDPSQPQYCGLTLEELLPTLPLLNRMLIPTMIHEHVGDRLLLRYPGALLARSDAPASPCESDLTVALPLLEPDGAALRWVPVVEELAPFAWDPARPESGVAAIRIRYPFHALALAGSLGIGAPAAPAEANPGERNALANAALPVGVPVGAAAEGIDPYGGAQGLGHRWGGALAIEPYRRMLSGEAAYRREVLLP